MTSYSNHRPILHRFRDKWRFTSKNFPVYLTPPLEGFTLELGVSTQGSEETRIMGLPEGWKSFKIGLVVLMQYWRVTDRHPPSQPASRSQPRCRSKYRAYYVVRVKTVMICLFFDTIPALVVQSNRRTELTEFRRGPLTFERMAGEKSARQIWHLKNLHIFRAMWSTTVLTLSIICNDLFFRLILQCLQKPKKCFELHLQKTLRLAH